MAGNLCFFFILLCLLSQSTARANPLPNPNRNSDFNSSNLLSAHDELKTNGFPVGLLPMNVLEYNLNRTSGDFSVNLDGSCKITLPPDNYLATYSKKITGKLVEGKIAMLEGIRVWAFFKWWSITGIRSTGDNLVFEVGGITAKYPSKNFDDIPACEGRHSSSWVSHVIKRLMFWSSPLFLSFKIPFWLVGFVFFAKLATLCVWNSSLLKILGIERLIRKNRRWMLRFENWLS